MDNIWTTIGIASIISVSVSFIFDTIRTRLNIKFEKIIIEKEHRYRSMLVFMSVVLDVSNYSHIETQYRPAKSEDIKSYYLAEVNLHLKFFQLFASKAVIESIKLFIENPNDEQYQLVANEMRRDLWARKVRIK